MDVCIDAKHSYEDSIIPVEEFYGRYGKRIAILGGLDVNLLAGADEYAVRSRVKEILDICVHEGRYASGSGNSIANYCKIENVLAIYDETYMWNK